MKLSRKNYIIIAKKKLIRAIKATIQDSDEIRKCAIAYPVVLKDFPVSRTNL